MRIIGVTGAIGSGKSTVSSILQGYGAELIDADVVAREVVQKGEKALNEITAYFGSDILDERGELARSKLAGLVFGDAEKLEVLNSITHKYIMERILKLVEQAKSENKSDMVVIDVPLPVKHGFLDTVDEVWVVSASMETRIRRVMERSRLSRQEVVDRMNSQMSADEYLKLANRVIYNDGDLSELKNDVLKLLRSG